MSQIKPSLAPERVKALLQTHFDGPATGLTTAEGGNVAQVFFFRVEAQEYVIRFNTTHMMANYEKEAYIYEHYASPRVPIPAILHIGPFEDLVYAISQRVPGEPLNAISPEHYEQLIPSLVATLDAIHHFDVADKPNYGLFDGKGVGFYPSWKHSLARIREEDPAWDFYGKWHVLFDDTFLERDFFDEIYARMVRLLDHCPEAHTFVHGGYGFGNVMAYEGKITGVLDWLDAKYGDFVYDIAWLDFWPTGFHFQELFRQHYAAQGRILPAYAERMLCYKLYIGLDGLRFFAKDGNHDNYQWLRQHLLDILAASGV